MLGDTLASATEVVAGATDASGHALLGLLQVGARVVDLLIADSAIDHEHAIVVLDNVSGEASVTVPKPTSNSFAD